MNRFCAIVAIGMFVGIANLSLVYAQPQVRSEDHFWRKRIVNRIPLTEKINRPLAQHMSEYYAGDGRFTETDGMVVSLVNGLKQGKYLAYHPEDWNKKMNYQDLHQRMEEFEQALTGESTTWDSEEVESDAFEKAETDSEWEWDLAEGEDSEEWGSPFEEEPEFEDNSIPIEQDYASYEEVIHMVEDWIFDKNTSSMVQKIDFFEVVWVDPTGILPEKVLARFKWEDVKEQMDVTMWKTRFNDAEARSIKEVFELRIFHGFFINVGGEPIRTLAEAERRRQELIEFESYLWSY
ncbi:MAG: hypothetical protein AAF587_26515 [Bacteroidota bacterium]